MTTQRKVVPRMITALGLAGLLSGLAIVLVYDFTLPMVEANRARALRRAVFKVVPGSAALQKLELSDGQEVYTAYDAQGLFMGYAIPAAGAGFQDTIRLIYGYDPRQQQVVGMEILESKETPGLGDKIFKDAAFQENFKALAVAPEIVLVKPGSKTKAHEVDGISGATISAKAVVKILQSSNSRCLQLLPKLGSEPVLVPQEKEGGEQR